MDRRVLENHARRLADRFYRQQDVYLIRRLRERAKRERRDALSQASGIRNRRVLDRLLELDLNAEIVASLALVPLIEVAWADGHVSPEERAAILRAAEACDLSVDEVPLESWLSEPPKAELLEAWVLYIDGLCEMMSADERDAFRRELLGEARRVAAASGGFLGVTSPVSDAEQKMIETLEGAFGRTSCEDGERRV